MSDARKISYWAIAVFAAAAVYWQLSSALLAGLFSFFVLDLTYKRLSRVLPRAPARWASFGVFLVSSVFFVWMLGIFIKLSATRVPEMISIVLPRLNALATNYGLSMPGSLEDLRGVIISAVVEHAQALTKTSGVLTRELFEILISVLVALLYHLSVSRKMGIRDDAAPRGNLLGAFLAEFAQRTTIFVGGFETIFRIQILLAAFRCAVLAVFLLLTRMPWTHFLLVATFLLSVIPIVGAFTSSALILAAAFTVSFHAAIGTLVFLLILHQAEYLIYSRLVGTEFALPTWLILLGLLIGEKCLGLAGLILAPVVIHYLREELRRLPGPPLSAD
ncbi:MAG TPA: AI-2E family transporter [Elusimicrobiota bacterium]|nr:AI-2E family transporter [Elusimicrobiota bacterium]